MYDTGSFTAEFCRQVPHVMEQRINQRPRTIAAPGMYDQAGGLIYSYQFIIFEQYPKRNALCLRLCSLTRDALVGFHFDPIAVLYGMAFPPHEAVNQNPAGVYHSLSLHPGYAVDMLGNGPIEALPGVFVTYMMTPMHGSIA